jgi:hypothetical protein
LTRAVTGTLAFALRALLALVVVEGAASLLLLAFVVPVLVRPPFAERQHTRYDAELGWVNVPGTSRPDMYGPRRALTINARGFRGGEIASGPVPAGRRRLVCAGDSFTFGYGVADDATWCAKLAVIDPDLETVNMGQGGYGVDQSHLWYRRDGVPLPHDVLVFAFIGEGFARMQLSDFFGYGKPVLRLRDGVLVPDNVPVPRAAYWAPWITQNLDVLAQFRSLQLLGVAVRWLVPRREVAFEGADLPRIVLAMFEELREVTRRHGRRLLLVYLPGSGDREPNSWDGWRRFLAAEAATREIPFVDLAEAMRAEVPAERVDDLFIPEGALTYPGAAGHLSEAGNDWVARRLHAALTRRESRPP